MAEKAPLIEPNNLPDDLLETLSHKMILKVGYFLFAQLVKQRDADHKHYTGKEAKQ